MTVTNMLMAHVVRNGAGDVRLGAAAFLSVPGEAAPMPMLAPAPVDGAAAARRYLDLSALPNAAVTDSVIDEKDRLLDGLIAVRADSRLAVEKLRILVQRMRENLLDESEYAEDRRDFRLAESALADLCGLAGEARR